MLGDRETGSRWDHIRGEAFGGPLKGRQLPVWPIYLTTAAAALAEYPEITLSSSTSRSPMRWFFHLFHRFKIEGRGFIPPPFRLTMRTPIDSRLDSLAQGLGVVAGRTARYYPLECLARGEAIVDQLGGRPLQVSRRALDGVLHARWADTGEEPLQLLSRWYGFSFTYPDCEIYTPDHFNPGG